MPEALAEVRRDCLMKPFENLTKQHLHAILRAWRDWLTFQGITADKFIEPTGMEMAIFLQKVAERGPSVAPARLRAFRWLREHLGVPFPVQSRLVKGFHHTPQDITPPKPEPYPQRSFGTWLPPTRGRVGIGPSRSTS